MGGVDPGCRFHLKEGTSRRTLGRKVVGRRLDDDEGQDQEKPLDRRSGSPSLFPTPLDRVSGPSLDPLKPHTRERGNERERERKTQSYDPVAGRGEGDRREESPGEPGDSSRPSTHPETTPMNRRTVGGVPVGDHPCKTTVLHVSVVLALIIIWKGVAGSMAGVLSRETTESPSESGRETLMIIPQRFLRKGDHV